MSKTLKISILLIITLGFLFLSQTEVSAVEVNSAETLQECFEGKNVVINGTTITLNDDVSFGEDTIEFNNGEYVLNLNGHELTVNSLVCKGTLIINDTIEGTIIGNISNYGILTINNGTFRGCIFSYEEGSLIISAGNFETTDTIGEYGAIAIETANSISSYEIYNHIADGSGIIYDTFWVGNNQDYDETTGNTYFWGNYGPTVKVVAPTEYELNLIKKIAPDGKNAVLKTVKPENEMEADFLITNVVNALLDEENYSAYATVNMDNMSECTINICGDFFDKTYEINVTYDEPNDSEEIQTFINRMKDFNDSDIESYYHLKDLGLINYYMTSANSELWNRGAPARALKYSEDIINMSNGGNIKYYLEVMAGCEDESLMYEYAFGEMTVFYNGYAYANKQQGLHLKRIIYIPQDTENTKEAYVSAAQKRINEYLGAEDLVTVEYGGLLNSLDEFCLDEAVPVEETDGNYYNITVKGKTYKFYILKGSQEQLEAPIYKGIDYETDIKVTSEDANVPLDTSVNVKDIVSEQIKKVLGTENYKAYDISLYSDGKASSIEKLDNGKFIVSIPVPEILKDKEITVYYINSNGEKEEHIATVKEGIASFETDHFSTYILVENNGKDDEPQMGNINVINFLMGMVLVSGIGIVLLRKKK